MRTNSQTRFLLQSWTLSVSGVFKFPLPYNRMQRKTEAKEKHKPKKKRKGAFELTEMGPLLMKEKAPRYEIKKLGLLLMRLTPAISIYYNAVINKFILSYKRSHI